MDESCLAVADYLLGQYYNFLQFAGQKDGATQCAQIVQLLLANHVDRDVSDPLVAVQLDASNAFCSVARQPQFNVLAGIELEVGIWVHRNIASRRKLTQS